MNESDVTALFVLSLHTHIQIKNPASESSESEGENVADVQAVFSDRKGPKEKRSILDIVFVS